jgi:Anti-sigma factor NepR
MIMKDKIVQSGQKRARSGRNDDGLGANSDVGARLRALYGSVQEEGIPDRILDLLDKLDAAESQAQVKSSSRGK